ncbi:MAG: START-like domain-containing protein [Bacteroides sp.]
MKKEKLHIEYSLNATSKNIIWGAISTPMGLENWFADKVESKDKIFTFTWGKTEIKQAEIINYRVNTFIRFHWLEDDNEEDAKDYFELKMNFNELTGDYGLEITDFAEPGEVADQKNLWDSQIETFKRVCGM